MSKLKGTSKNVEVGDVYSTNEGGSVEVIELIVPGKCVVKMKSGVEEYLQITSRWRVITGDLKNRYIRSVYGVGYLGKRREEYINKDPHPNFTNILRIRWKAMLQRVYNKCERGLRFYGDVSLSEEFHDFSIFREFIISILPKGSNIGEYDIDKDLLSPGSNIYSRDTIILLPPEINKMLKVRDNKCGIMGLEYSKVNKAFIINLVKASNERRGRRIYLGRKNTVNFDKAAMVYYPSYMNSMMSNFLVVAKRYYYKEELKKILKLYKGYVEYLMDEQGTSNLKETRERLKVIIEGTWVPSNS